MHRFYTWLRTHPIVVDGIWAIGLMFISVVQVVMQYLSFRHGYAGPDGHRYGPVHSVLALVFAAVISAAITVKRRYPVLTGFAVLAVGIVQLATGVGFVFADLGALAMVYNAAGYGPRWLSRTALVCGALAGPASAIRFSSPTALNDFWGMVIGAILSAAPFVVAWALGDLTRTRRAYYASLEDRARRLERERDAQTKVAAAAERARIARELHDVVAHNVSVMVVQADGAKFVLDQAPEQAKEALDTIAGTGRQALTEMRRLLGVLRSEEAIEFVPQPGVEQIGDLLEQVRGAGLPVEFSVDGEVRPLSRGIELTVFRIVQEALTNTRKHGGPNAAAAVHLYYGDSELDLTVEDDGRGAAAALHDRGGADGLGHGLIGMRERVGMVGGTFSAGPRPGGGFRTRAVLPLPAAAPHT
ncbi:two-component sensor histidine kinase [Mangrovactinospora gilvigrisea]|uniref:histidine kinase n=1 Tax=Mangrovactinospora gilvigrisea TaxID=1428644 RepID=A0A1J7C6Z8_9ACTN|nr:histidine kinase [Mangrovactinospora gilvigrisea]OIV37328.1 two-component sensor histidine kinase [Mangrovactinospora gilvigrisea]